MYKDNLDAAHQRIKALEEEIKRLENKSSLENDIPIVKSNRIAVIKGILSSNIYEWVPVDPVVVNLGIEGFETDYSFRRDNAGLIVNPTKLIYIKPRLLLVSVGYLYFKLYNNRNIITNKSKPVLKEREFRKELKLFCKNVIMRQVLHPNK
jgi:hypothetical protein